MTSTTFTNIKYDNPKKMSFTINDVELSIVNSIRRIILAEIPNVGFYFDPTDIEHSEIKINKNTCALHNEFLAHRISLVPLCFSENEINEFEPTKYKFVLKKQNTSYEIMDVTTKDFEIYDDKDKIYPESFKEKIFPKNEITGEYILLTKLKPNLYEEKTPPKGEMVDITCYPSINIAQKHARWSPVSLCTFGNTIDKELAAEKFEEHLRKHEQEIGRKVTNEEKSLQLKRFNTLEVYRCFKKNKYDEANTFDFKLESECNMRPAFLFFKACKILIEKISSFVDNIKNKNETSVKINKLVGLDEFYNIEVYNEDYTLLNVLQSNIYNICFKETKLANNPFEYIGYNQPHPLDNVMVLKLKMHKFEDKVITKDYVAGLLVDYSNDIISKIKHFLKEWLSVVEKDIKDVKEVIAFKDTL
jgi:DNA-directed RNA polymerase subunit L